MREGLFLMGVWSRPRLPGSLEGAHRSFSMWCLYSDRGLAHYKVPACTHFYVCLGRRHSQAETVDALCWQGQPTTKGGSWRDLLPFLDSQDPHGLKTRRPEDLKITEGYYPALARIAEYCCCAPDQDPTVRTCNRMGGGRRAAWPRTTFACADVVQGKEEHLRLGGREKKAPGVKKT